LWSPTNQNGFQRFSRYNAITAPVTAARHRETVCRLSPGFAAKL